jgi:hypothetical protein
MKLILLAVCILFVICSGCATTQIPQVVERIHPIETPKPPNNFAVVEPGLPRTLDREWIEIEHLKPKQYWRAYSDGAVVLKPSDWRVLMTTRNRIDKWIADEVSRIKEHNEKVKKISPELQKESKR